MEDVLEVLNQIYTDYSVELEACEKKQKVTDGLFGFGHSIKDDPCHERFYDRIQEAMNQLTASAPPSEQAESTILYLFSRKKEYAYPPSAQLMLCAVEKHILPLIPYLTPQAAKHILDEYETMYRRWERLPVQTEVWKTLKKAAGKY